MAQVGRISGPLLQENLERNGIDLAFETDLLYLDVNTGRIGVKNNSPTNAITVSGTTRINNFQVDSEADISNLNFQNSTIEPLPGSLFLDAVSTITSTRINTDNIDIDNNVIKTFTPNSNLELRPDGTGKVDVYSNVLTQGNMHTTGNITVGGNIVFGNSDEDTVTFDSEITSDLVPDEDLVYNLGTSSKRWFQLNAENLNGEDIDTAVVTVQGLDLGVRQGNLYYVSVNGDNSNDGDHQQSPFRTIDYAVTQASAGDTIYVYPGEYEETTPIVIPKGVSVIGHDMRNTVVSPPSSANSNDIFWVNGEVTVENLTVKDFFYDDVNDTGYAFRFAPNTEISSRSPYIKNVSVITSGSNITPEDPRGFGSGDAGKGALVDGVEVLDSSTGASMLFHAVTFITPGVDALTMTNGVRVEWLNSFTYFANRGLYAKNGVNGWLSTDGSTVRYGAELRSIGSANVYGNFGAVADGADTLMYLIMHNFAYIGSGKDVTNDTSLVIENQQTVELSNGTIHYQSTDQLGKFKVGDNFFVDFETGSTSVNIDSLTANSLSGLVVSTNGSETFITGNKIETGNIRFTDNSTLSLTGDYNVNSASGVINLKKDTNIENNLDITGDFGFGGSINFYGDQPLDTVTFNTEFSQDLEPDQDLKFNLGSIDKKWLSGYFNGADIDGVKIFDNQITSKDSNADLDIRANGTGRIYIPLNDTRIQNNLTVSSTANFSDIDLNNLSLSGNQTQIGNRTLTEDLEIGNTLTVDASAQFEEILINNNFITTVSSNTDLELRAEPDGIVNVPTEDFQINNNLNINGTFNSVDITSSGQITAQKFDTSDIEIYSNVIETTNVNSDLILDATKNISVTQTDVLLNQNLTVSGASTLISTTVNGNINHIGDRVHTGNYNISGEIVNGDLIIEDNYISSTNLNEDLNLSANGNIIVSNNNVEFLQNFTVDGTTDIQDLSVTGTVTHTGDTVQTGNLSIDGVFSSDDIEISANRIKTTDSNSDLELRANGTGDITTLTTDVVFEKDLSVNGSTDVQNLTVTGDVTHTGSRTHTGNYSIAGELFVDDIRIEDNFVNSTAGNLILSAPASQRIISPTSSNTFNQSLFVQGATDVKDLTINGNVAHNGTRNHFGDKTVTGNVDITGELSVNSKTVFEEIKINGNTVETYQNNKDLNLKATGDVVIPDNSVSFANNLNVDNLTVAENIVIDEDISLNEIVIPPSIIEIDDNFIDTNISNADLDLRAAGAGTVSLRENVILSNDFSVESASSLENLTIVGLKTHTGDSVVFGNTDLSGKLTVTDIVTDRKAVFDQVTVNGNSVSTENQDLELKAAGNVVFKSLIVDNNQNARNVSAQDVVIDTSFDLENMVSSTDIEIFDNSISTTNSNSNLELRATGDVLLLDPVAITQNLSVVGISNLLETNINGTLSVQGDITRTGNTEIFGNLDLDGRFTTDHKSVFNNFSIDGNRLQFLPGTDFDLKASGAGTVTFDKLTEVQNNLSAANISTDSIQINNSFGLENLVSSTDIEIFDNVITTTNSNSDLELRAAGTGTINLQAIKISDNTLFTVSENILFENQNIVISATGAIRLSNGDIAQRIEADGNPGDIRFNTELNVFEGFSQTAQYFGGVYSENSLTNITASNNNEIDFVINQSLVAQVNAADGMILKRLDVNSLIFDSNSVVSVDNNDILFSKNGTGDISVNDIRINTNTISNISNGELSLDTSENGYVKINSTSGVVIPVGDESNKGSTPETGEVRWNTELQIKEVYTGTEWVSVAGAVDNVTAAEMGELIDEWSLILG